ncbi:hypothetical protein D3C78_1133360 [compost metagenome]
MMLFHAGIGIGMGLLTFSLTMVFMELLVITDREYKSIVSKTGTFYKNYSTALLRYSGRLGERYLYSQRIVVFFDGWCPMCRGIVTKIATMDYFRLITCISFRDDSVIAKYSLNPEDIQLRMHSTKLSRVSLKAGIHSVLQISCRLLPLWPLVPMIYFFKVIGLGQYMYDFIAKRRLIVPVNHCDDSCEITITNH